MSRDLELEAWQREWQSDGAEIATLDLRRKVERQTRLMRWTLAGDCAVTVVIGGGVILWSALSSATGTGSLVAATWIFLAAAWAFVLTANAGNWLPASHDTAEFLDLSIRRARAAVRATSFQALLFWTEIVFCLGWIYRHSHVPQPVIEWLLPLSIRMICIWLGSAVFSVFLIGFRRRKQRELSGLIEVKNQTNASN